MGSMAPGAKAWAQAAMARTRAARENMVFVLVEILGTEIAYFLPTFGTEARRLQF